MASTENSSAARALPTGRDELNLIDFPISLLQYQQPKDANGKTPDELVCTIESYDRHLDRIVPRKLTRRTASKYGFPTPVEEVVLVALLTLSRIKNDFQSPRVHFRNSELYELMGWPANGNSSEQLSVALDRLKGLSLKYENAWTTGGNQFKKDFTTGLLDSYEFVTKTGSQGSTGTSWIQWASEIYADIQKGNVKQLDTERYFSLKYPITKRIYRFLDKHFGDGPTFAMDLLTFAAHVGISGTKHIGKIKGRLARSIKELEELGDFVLPLDNRYTKQGVGRWTIHFEASDEKQTRVVSKRRRAKPANNETAFQLVTDFYSTWAGDSLHRVTKHEVAQAQGVVDKYGAEKASQLLPLLIRQLKKNWPDAKRFGATMDYWHEAEKAWQRREKSRAPASSITAKQSSDRSAKRERTNRLRQQWSQLTESQKQLIRHRVSQAATEFVRRKLAAEQYDDLLVEMACLDELERSPVGC